MIRKFWNNRNIVNSIWNLIDIFCYPVLFFCSAPFFIHQLGSGQFGIWMLINTIVISMQVFNFGIGSSVFKSVALHVGHENEQGKKEIINGALSLNILLFGLCILTGIILAYFVYFHHFLHVSRNFRLLCTKGILLSGFIVGFKFLEQVFVNYFKALEQFDKAALLSGGNKVLALSINILMLALWGGNILQILIILIATNFVFLLISFYLLYQNLPRYRFGFHPKLPRQDARFALFVWLQTVAFLFIAQADRFLVVNYFGLAALSFYALTATIFSHLHLGISALIPWMSPKLTKRSAKKMDTYDLYYSGHNLLSACALTLLMLLAALYPFIFRIILGRETYLGIDPYVPYFIIYEVFFCLGIVPAYYFNALGFEKRFFYFVLFFMLASLTGMMICLAIFQTPVSLRYGLIIACMIGMFVLHILLNRVMHRRLRLAETVWLLLPSLLVSLFVLLPATASLKLPAAVVAIGSIYFIYVRGNRTKFKLLFRSW